MAKSVSYVFIAKDRFTKVVDRIARKSMELRSKFEKVRHSTEKMNAAVKRAGQAIQSFGRKMTVIGAALTAYGTYAVSLAGKNEQMAISFEVLSGSVQTGQDLMERMFTFAAKTPFEISGIQNATKMLLAMGVEAKDMDKTWKMLGNMAAGTGRSMEEFALVYGQIKSTTFLTGGDAMQLTNKGIGIRNLIAEHLTAKTGKEVTVAQVYDLISKRLISAELVDEILNKMVSEGGRFYGLMDKLSATFLGQWANVQDNLYKANIELGKALIKHLGLADLMKRLADWTEKLPDKISKWAEKHPALLKFVAVMSIMLLVLGPIVVLVGTMVVAITAIASVLGVAAVSVLGFAAAAVGAFVAVAAAITAVWYWGQDLMDMFSNLGTTIADFAKALESKAINKIHHVMAWVGIIDSVPTTGQIDVNINDGGGNVANVKSSSAGPVKINTGLNMSSGASASW